MTHTKRSPEALAGAGGADDLATFGISDNTTPAETAQALAERLTPVFPVRLSEPDANGKRKKTPLTDHGHNDASVDLATVERWWSQWPDAVPGVPTGKASNIWVLDVDPDGEQWAADHAGLLMAAGSIHKSERGRHYLYTYADGIRNTDGAIAEGIDTRGEGGFIVWWPARGLTFTGDLSDISAAPDALVGLAKNAQRPAKAARRTETAKGGNTIAEGQRNATLTSYAGSLRRIGMDAQEIEAALHGINDKRCSPPLDNAEIRQIAQSIARYAPEQAEAGARFEAVSNDPAGWPDPIPLQGKPPARLPVHKWPKVLSEYALGAAEETETPVELPAMMAATVISVALQRQADVEIKPGYREPLSLYTVTVMEPATRKTQEWNRAIKPLSQWEKRRRENLEPEIAKAQARRDTAGERLKQKKTEAKKAKSDDEAARIADEAADLEASLPEVPTVPRLYTTDVTPENLGTKMADQGGVMAGLSDEGGILETMAGRYANGVPNIDLLLKAHAGSSVRIDRGSKPAEILDDPRLAIGLTVQPDVIAAMQSKPGFRGRGLLGRFLYAIPPTNLGQRTGKGARMNVFSENDYGNAVKALLDMPETEAEERQAIQLSPEARDAWQRYWGETERELADGGAFEHCRDWAGKLPGAVARLAAVFHGAEYGARFIGVPINAETMEAAIETGRALADHALKAFDLMGDDPELEGARRLLAWIRRHGRSEFTARDAYRGNQSHFRTAADMAPCLNLLAERDYILAAGTEKKTGRPSEQYAVNPKAHE